MKYRTVHATLVIVVAAFLNVLYLSCSKDDNPASTSDNPEIVGCNSVKYKGTTFSNLGCAPGIASFDVTISQGGATGSFHVTCSNGCLSSVTVK